jgi:hypothetical protein
MLTITRSQTQTCFDAWMNCENLLVSLAEVKNCFSRQVTKVIDECAFICLGTFHAMKSGSANVRNMALLCIGICEECAELCENQYGEAFHECARICRRCSQNLSVLKLNES